MWKPCNSNFEHQWIGSIFLCVLRKPFCKKKACGLQVLKKSVVVRSWKLTFGSMGFHHSVKQSGMLWLVLGFGNIILERLQAPERCGKPVLWSVQNRGLVLDCPEPHVTIRGCADPAAVLLSEDRLTVKFPKAHSPPSTAAWLPDLLFMGTLAQHHNHTLLCLIFVWSWAGAIEYISMLWSVNSGRVWSNMRRQQRPYGYKLVIW